MSHTGLAPVLAYLAPLARVYHGPVPGPDGVEPGPCGTLPNEPTSEEQTPSPGIVKHGESLSKELLSREL